MTRIPGHKPHWRNQARANPWHPDVNGVWAPNDGSPGWLAGLHAYEHGKVSFACCGNQTATGGVWAPNDGSPGWLAGKAEGCGCDATSGLWAPNDGSPGWLAGQHGATAGNPPPVKKLDKNTWQQWAAAIDKTSINDKAKCVITSWLGGVPESSFDKFSQDAKAAWNDTHWWQLLPVTLPGTILWNVAGAAFETAKAGGIYTLSDACPGGPTIEEAFALLMNPVTGDPTLAVDVMRVAAGHRAHLVQSVVENTQQNRKELVANAAAAAYDGVSNTLGKLYPDGFAGAALGIGTGTLLLGAAAVYLFLKFKP